MKTIDALIKNAHAFLPSDSIITALEQKKHLLYSDWSEAFLAHPFHDDVSALGHIGFFSEHPGYHLQLLQQMVRHRHTELLIKYIAWEYRVLRNRRIAYDYLAWTFTHWRGAMGKYLDPLAAAPVVKLYDFLTAQHANFIEIAESNAPLLTPQLAAWEAPQKELLSLLFKGNAVECLKLASSLVHSATDYKNFCLHVIQPVMYQIGTMWEKGAVSAVQEHLSTAIVSRMLFSLYAPYVISDAQKGRAVIAAALNENHEIGARIVADFLEIDGWDVYYLGAGTPQDEVIEMIKILNPDIIGLYVVMPFNLEHARQLILKLRQDRIRGKIMIGGSLAAAIPAVYLFAGADICCKNAQEALAWAQTVWNGKIRSRHAR